MSFSPLPRSSKPRRQSPFFRDLTSPISIHRGGRVVTPGQAVSVSALWWENLSSSDCPPPPVFTLDDRADFSPEPSLAGIPFRHEEPDPAPLSRGGSGSFCRSPLLSSPSGLRTKTEVNDSEGKKAAPQSPESSSWIHGLRVGGGGQGETGTGSPVTGVVEPGALLMLPPPREVARPEAQKSSSVPNGGHNEDWVTVFGFSPGDTNLVLHEFEKCGPILKHVPGPRDANWMHILFQIYLRVSKGTSFATCEPGCCDELDIVNPYDVRKALGKNGTQINSILMIGVKLVDPVHQQCLTDKHNNINHGGFMVSLPSKLPDTRNSAAPSSSGALSCSYHPKTSTNAVTDSGWHSAGNIASPAESIVSKVMDLMFGV
ncbi:Nuclear pore complex protein NUP35 [Cocos nucifera]|uniref:Nuclear pore complex protein NUP35 n=1 Tax=Cocos nucifera TaxID=13894 RepID=A0A8K0NC24_COCNU|nr:Nuclear pore complex protein NUP35 [Cocos nucifera]